MIGLLSSAGFSSAGFSSTSVFFTAIPHHLHLASYQYKQKKAPTQKDE